MALAGLVQNNAVASASAVASQAISPLTNIVGADSIKLIVSAVGAAAVNLSVSDSVNGAWTRDVQGANAQTSGIAGLAIFTCPATSLATSAVITASTSGGSTPFGVGLYVVTNAGALDKTSTGLNTGLAYSVGSFVPTFSSLAIAAIGAAYTGLLADFAPGAGWTQVAGVPINAGNTSRPVAVMYRVSDGQATTAPGAGNVSHIWAEVCASYLALQKSTRWIKVNGVWVASAQTMFYNGSVWS